jgi:Carboxypeptidase regulatory-like domain
MKALLAMILIALSAHPRTDGAIVGWVTDNRNVPIPAAHVDVTDNETGQVTGSLTGDDGRFTVSGLVVGHHYSILTRCIGFAPSRMAGVEPLPAGANDAGHLAIFELARIEVRLSAR